MSSPLSSIEAHFPSDEASPSSRSPKGFRRTNSSNSLSSSKSLLASLHSRRMSQQEYPQFDSLSPGTPTADHRKSLNSEFFSTSPPRTPQHSRSPSILTKRSHFHSSISTRDVHDQSDTLSTLSDLSVASTGGGSGYYTSLSTVNSYGNLSEAQLVAMNAHDVLDSALESLEAKHKKLTRKMQKRKKRLRNRTTGQEIRVEFREEFGGESVRKRVNNRLTMISEDVVDPKRPASASARGHRVVSSTGSTGSRSPTQNITSTVESRKHSYQHEHDVVIGETSTSRFSIMSDPTTPVLASTPKSTNKSLNSSTSSGKSTSRRHSKGAPRRTFVYPAPAFKKKPISTKKLLKLYPELEFETVEGSPTAVYIGPDMIAHRYHITRKQLLLILQKKSEEKLLRMQRAKSYANRLNRFSARFGCNGEIHGKPVITYTSEIIRSTLTTWVLRVRFQKIRRAVRRLQNWWRTIREQKTQRNFALLIQHSQEMEELGKLKLQVLVQKHFRTYVQMIEVVHLLRDKFSRPVQNVFRMIPYRDEHKHKLELVLMCQSAVRVHQARLEYLEKIRSCITDMKREVLEEYERVLAPYSRRAVFCYSTRQVDASTFSDCFRELQTLKMQKGRTMSEKEFQAHLDDVFEKLKVHADDASLISIITKVFKPYLVHPKSRASAGRSLFGKKKRKSGADEASAGDDRTSISTSAGVNTEGLDDPPNDMDSLPVPIPFDLHYITKISQLPFPHILREVIKFMFDPMASQDRANWSAVIIMNWYLSWNAEEGF